MVVMPAFTENLLAKPSNRQFNCIMPGSLKKLFLVSIFFLSAAALAEQQLSATQNEVMQMTENQLYKVSVTSKLSPIRINTMHAWVIHIENQTGQPVGNASIAIKGGMPEHNHGFPARPQVTKDLGDGRYLLEGMKFHMGGWWQVTMTISDGINVDNVTFDVQL